MPRVFDRIAKHLYRNKIWYYGSFFAFVGTVLIISSRAATSSVGVEAESGSLTTPATTNQSSEASGGAYIKFGASSPTTNAILFGSNRPDETDAKFTEAEASLGRNFDVVRIFRTNFASTFTKELEYANKGKIVHTSFNMSGTLGGNWKAISDQLRTQGSSLRTQAETLAANMQSQMPGPFIVTFQHEPERSGYFDGAAGSGKTGQDYTDMVCALYFIFKTQGASKAKFSTVAVPTPHYQSNNTRGAQIYPGDQCTDFNGVDPYNFFNNEDPSNWKTLEQILMNKTASGTQNTATGWYQWATKDFTGVPCSGIGSQSNNPLCQNEVVRKLDGTTETKLAKGNKPLLIAEYGTSEYYSACTTVSSCNYAHAMDANKKADWYRQLPNDFKTKMPAFKVIQHWGTISVGSGETSAHCFGNDFRFNTTMPTATMTCGTNVSTIPTSYTAPSFLGFKEIASDGYFHMTKGLTDGTASSPAAQKRFDFINSLF